MTTFSEKLFRCEKEQWNTHTTENTAIASTLKLHRLQQLKTCMIYGVLCVSFHPTQGCVSALAACRHQAQGSCSVIQLNTGPQSAAAAANIRSRPLSGVFNTSWHWTPNTSELIYLLKIKDKYSVNKRSFTAWMCAKWTFQSTTQ